MKRKTFWLRKWAGWSLALACSCSSLPVLHGQSAQPKLPGPGGIPHGGYPVLAQSSTPVMSLEQMQEDRLLLAWLSDPVTFKLNLKIQNTNGGLKVVGCVPNDSVRKRVMEIASRTTGGFVQDGLKSVPGMLPGFSENLTPQELREQAQTMIRATVPDCANRVEIQTDQFGRVTLTGQVHTLKDVLHVCQCLRQIPQCSGLVNRLSLSGFTQPPQVAVIHKGTPPLLPKGIPTIPEKKPAPGQMTIVPVVPITKAVEPPSVPSPKKESAAPDIAKTTWTAKTTWAAVPVPKPQKNQDHSHNSVSGMPVPGQLPSGNKIISYDLGPPYEAIAVVSLAGADTPEPVKSMAPVKVKSELQPVNFQKSTPVPAPKTKPVVPPLPTKTAPTPLPTKTAPTPKAQPMVLPLPTTTVAKLPAVPTKPIATEPTLPKKTVNNPVPPLKTVTNPVVPPLKTVTNAVPPLAKNHPSPAQVKWLVEKHCGSKVRNVTVRYMDNGKMEIRLQVQQETHAPAVFEQIVRIGELGPYQIKLKVEVVH